MSINKNKPFIDVEVISSRKIKPNITSGKIITVVICLVFISMLIGSILENNSQKQHNELTKATAAETKNPKLEEAEKKLEEAKKEVESLKVQAPLIDDKTELPKEAKVEEKVVKQEVKAETSKAYNNLGINPNTISIIEKVAKEYGIKPEYLITIGLSENIYNPEAIGDNGCSFGIYQINECARRGATFNGLDIRECAKSIDCSSRWTANRIKNVYFKGYSETSWIYALSKHNGQVFCPKTTKCTPEELVSPEFYRVKINKNGLKSGLTI